jgi:hypothetical protein
MANDLLMLVCVYAVLLLALLIGHQLKGAFTDWRDRKRASDGR